MKKLLPALVALALPLALLTGCPSNDDSGCKADTDCAEGQVCNDGTCEADTTGCTADTDCAAGQVCNNGTCEADTSGCTADTDCADGEVCNNGTCETAATSCTSDADCSDTEICDNGTCVSTLCTSDADCAGEQWKTKCDTTTGACVECFTTADCTDADYPYCNNGNGYCVQCQGNSDCSDPMYPACDTTEGWCGCSADSDCSFGTCMTDPYYGITFCGCEADSDCSGETPYCNTDTNACVACTDSFQCTDAAAPACAENDAGATVCTTVDLCTTDDDAEQNDDGPAGATDLTPATGETTTTLTGVRKVCAQADESDWYKFDVPAHGNATLSVDWTATGADLDVQVVSADGVLYGMGWYAKPETVALTYLPAGTYYAVVSAYADAPSGDAIDYDISLELTEGTACTGIADCAAEYASQLLRGDCNATSGACLFIDGQAQVADGGACDSADDCASDSCGYGAFADNGQGGYAAFLFQKDADQVAFCGPATCTDASTCEAEQACNLGSCLPKCTEDAQCPVDFYGSASPNGWTHGTCDTASGACSF